MELSHVTTLEYRSPRARSRLLDVREGGYQLGQRIEMGPYTFEVAGAREGAWGSYPTIDISFRIHRDDAAPFTADFKGSFAYDMDLVDTAGNTIPVSPDPVSPVYRGGRQHSDTYVAKVRLAPSHEGVRDSARIVKSAGDFTLIIGNPAPERNQPRRVAIRLH